MYKAPDGKIFAGSFEGGCIYLSTNDGYNWKQIGVLGGYIFTFLMNRQTGCLFVGTSGGIYLTKDLGKSWSYKSDGLEDKCTKAFSIDYATGNIYAGTMHYPYYTPDPIRGIYLSSNSGDSWLNISNGVENNYVNDVFFDSVSNRLFVGTMEGVIFSTNNGKNWQFVEIPCWSTRSILRSKISNELILGADNGVYTSSDNGNNWDKINNTIESGYLLEIIASPLSGDLYIPSSISIQIIRHLENKWIIVKLLNVKEGVRSFNINSSGNILLSTPSRGISISTDDGVSWNTVGVANSKVKSIFINPTNGDLFIGAYDNEYLSNNKGMTWLELKSLYGDIRSFACGFDGSIFAGTHEYGLFVSTDKGMSWRNTGSGLPKSVLTIKLNKNDTSMLAGTYDGIFRSKDKGISWKPVNSGLGLVSVKTILIDENNGEILIGTSEGIYLSKNNGSNWTLVNNILSNKFIWTLAQNAVNNYTYAGTNGDGIFISKDRGRNWEQIITGLKNMDVRSIVVNSSGVVFACTFGGGVYRSIDTGNTWQELNSGLYNKNVNSIIIDSKDHLYSGVENGGVYYSTASTLPIDVFPGDANNDGFVNKDDLIPIAIYYNANGDRRINPSLEWKAQKIFFTEGWEPANACYTDCDGNGIVDSKDVLAIIINWGASRLIQNINNDKLRACEELLLATDRLPQIEAAGRIRTEILNYLKYELKQYPDYSLKQNYPNPFNFNTIIRYFVPQQTAEIKFFICNSLGQLVWDNSLRDVLPGYHEITWNGHTNSDRYVASGVYYFMLDFKDHKQMICMLLLK
jgi:photosystem II stability/assembly factor-like uncharacterized protein